MASIVVRGLDDEVKRRLAEQARAHGRSMEAEVRQILTKAADRPHIGLALMEAAAAVGPGVDPAGHRSDISFPDAVPARDDEARAAAFE